MSSLIYVIALIIIIVLFAVLEINQIFFRNKPLKSTDLINDITHLEAFEMIKNGEELMFADDLVIDIKDFKYNHPGGKFMLYESIGEDSGKFMIGCKGYANDYNPYTHSSKAFSYLSKLAIGRIPSPIGYIMHENCEESKIMEFTLSEKFPFNDHTFLIGLKSDFFKLTKTCQLPE